MSQEERKNERQEEAEGEKKRGEGVVQEASDTKVEGSSEEQGSQFSWKDRGASTAPSDTSCELFDYLASSSEDCV